MARRTKAEGDEDAQSYWMRLKVVFSRKVYLEPLCDIAQRAGRYAYAER